MAVTIRCSRCGQENETEFSFCQSCGQSLRQTTRACAGCGTALLPGARFCGRCGRPADAAPASPTPSPSRGRASPTPVRSAPPAGGGMEVREARVLRLVAVRHDGLPGPTYVITRSAIHCGRTQGEVLFPEDATVSPRHCRFSSRDDGVYVEDLGSVNGTFLRLRQPRTLSPGDEFRVGRQLLRLEPIPRPPVAEGAARPWGSADPGHRARLTQLLEGGGAGEVFPLRHGENALGREVGHVCFPGDRYVSARHARIDVSESSVLLTDVGSSNGTFARLGAPARLAAGDQVLVGMQLLRVEG